jgi:hypothetical protein
LGEWINHLASRLFNGLESWASGSSHWTIRSHPPQFDLSIKQRLALPEEIPDRASRAKDTDSASLGFECSKLKIKDRAESWICRIFEFNKS